MAQRTTNHLNGNQRARTRGYFSRVSPATLEDIAADIREASANGDWRTLSSCARALRSRGYHEMAKPVAALARKFERDQALNAARDLLSQT